MFQCWFPPSFSFRKKQYRVCYWSVIMINGAVCRTKNRPAIQLCYPAVNCSRQVVSSFLPGRLGQVHVSVRTFHFEKRLYETRWANSLAIFKKVLKETSEFWFSFVSDLHNRPSRLNVFADGDPSQSRNVHRLYTSMD